MQEIKERLDAELAAPPAPTFDVAATLGAGRRAVRRRRLAVGGAVLGLALVAGGAGFAVTSQFDGRGSHTTLQVAVAPGVSAEGLVGTTTLHDDFPVGYDAQSGDVRVAQGWEVLDRVDDPVTGLYDVQSPFAITDSVGLALRKGDTTIWAVLFLAPTPSAGDGSASETGGGFTENKVASGMADLSTWLQVRTSTEFTKKPRR